MEQICYIKDLIYIGPLHFGECIVSYSFTNSKSDVLLKGATSPSAGYATLTSWHEKQANISQPSPSGDIVVTFDNDQTVGKTDKVQLHSNVTLSVVTTVRAVFPISPNIQFESNIQTKQALTPINWASPLQYGGEDDLNRILPLFSKLDSECLEHMNSIASSYIEEHLLKLVKEQFFDENGILKDTFDFTSNEEFVQSETRKQPRIDEYLLKDGVVVKKTVKVGYNWDKS